MSPIDILREILDTRQHTSNVYISEFTTRYNAPYDPRKNTMHPNEQLIETFYSSFQKRDAEGMAACYHKDVAFSDPVFPDLHGDQARGMWRMLCARGKDLKIEFSAVRADDSKGSAHWEAWYTFSGSGRKVHNIIDAEFEFRDGKIIRHKDTFGFWRWSRMALGPAGVLLGWTPILLNGVRKKANKGLVDFMAK